MDQAKYEPTFEGSIKQVMQTLPQNVRIYISQEKYTIVVKELMTRYSLHIDQGGILEREIILLLMGIESPEEFTQALFEEARINKQTISSIAKDVNNQIFIPLREEMRKSGGADTARTAVSVKPLTQSASAPPKTNASTVEQKSNFNLQNKINPPIRQIHSDIKAPTLQNSPQQKTAMSRPISVGTAQPVLETKKPPKSNTLLEDHEEPSPLLKTIERKEVPVSTPPRISFNTVPTPAATPVASDNSSPLREALSKVLPGSNVPVPQKVVAPQSFVVRTTAAELMPNLPGAASLPVSPGPIPPKEVPAPSRITPPEKSQPKPISAPLKSYSSDPYREPVE